MGLSKGTLQRGTRVPRLVRVAGLVGLVGLAATGCSTDEVLRFGWPESVTPQAESMRQLWTWSVIAALVVGVIVWGLMFWTIAFHRKKGEELPLEELGAALQAGYGGTLGKYTSGLVSRLVGSKMPGGFNLSSIKSHLSKAWGLGSARADGVLLIALTMEPAKRLGSEAEAKTWLDGVVSIYAQRSGISLSSGAAAGGAGGGGGAVINSEEFLNFQSQQEHFVAQHIELHMRYLGLRLQGRRDHVR